MHALLHSLRKGSKGRAVDSQTEDSCARTINEMQARIDGASHGRSLLAQSSGADESTGADEELKQHAAALLSPTRGLRELHAFDERSPFERVLKSKVVVKLSERVLKSKASKAVGKTPSAPSALADERV